MSAGTVDEDDQVARAGAARGQAAGPATRVMVAVWVVPVLSTQVTRTATITLVAGPAA